MTRWRYASSTDTGLVRDLNEDALYVDAKLAVVADGMGGHAAGEVASVITVETVRERFERDQSVEGLRAAIESANRDIMANARENPDRFGMGTTVIAVGLTRDHHGVSSPTLFNVGDSRAYQLRDGALRQLSQDHSVAEEWVRMGRLTPEEASVHPRRHQLTRTLGLDEVVDIDVTSIEALPGDRLLLCSDGLSNELTSDELANLASAPVPLGRAVDQLMAAAKQCGAHDNITVILLEFDDVNMAASPISSTVDTVAPPVAPVSGPPRVRRSRRRWFTWRLALGLALFVATIVSFFFVMHWYAYSSYYLGDDAGIVAVYQGQPDGVLGFKPTKIVDTHFRLSQLLPADRQAVEATVSEPSLIAALHYARYLHGQWRMGQLTVTTTTTIAKKTSTTVVGAPTTTAKG